jgi:hypothetical protein
MTSIDPDDRPLTRREFQRLAAEREQEATQQEWSNQFDELAEPG